MDDLKLYEEIVRLQKERLPGVLATVVETRGSSPRKSGAKMLVYPDGTIAGTVGGGTTEAQTIAAALQAMGNGQPRLLEFSLTKENGSVCGGSMVIYLEPLVSAPLLIIVGSGHVAKAMQLAARAAGFLTTLLGPAEFLGNEQVAPAVDYESYIFIATSDHQQDFAAVRVALGTRARYIAVLGSRRKKQAMESYLQDVGLAASVIARVTSPAGLDIGAETPEEIAVSVVAQMIALRRAENGKSSRAAARCGTLEADGHLQTAVAAGRQGGDSA